MNFFDMLPDWNDFKSFFKDKWFTLYFLTIILVLVVSYYCAQNFWVPAHPFQRTDKELAIKADLENELHSLEALPGVFYGPIYSRGGRDSHDSWLVSSSFECEAPFSEVYRYYDDQLKAHWWKENGGRMKSACYKKNFYEAEIGQSDKQQNLYYISLTWHKINEHPPSDTQRMFEAFFVVIILPCFLIACLVSVIANNLKGKNKI